jgi:3-hydroxyacyl-[acyl-carrier-protein] dehydratase
LLIDRLLALETGKRAVAVKTFSPDEEFFADHFPGFPVVPGVLVTEAMGQTGGWLLACTLDFSRLLLLSMIDKAKFFRLVLPGEELCLEATVRNMKESDFEVEAEARVGGERAAAARLLFHAFDASLAPGKMRELDLWNRRTFRRLGGEDILRRRDRVSSPTASSPD